MTEHHSQVFPLDKLVAQGDLPRHLTLASHNGLIHMGVQLALVSIDPEADGVIP